MAIVEKYSVRPISRQLWLEWVLHRHYAKRSPHVSHAYGLFCMDKLVGVVTYGQMVNLTLVKVWKGDYEVIELNRLIVDDGLDRNALSFLVSQSLRMLPKPLVVVSYADTSMGHHGYIYQATNWIYTGLSKKYKSPHIVGQRDVHQSSIERMGTVSELKERFGELFTYIDRPRKHRYFYFVGSRRQVRGMREMLPYAIEPYPKGENSTYDSGTLPSRSQGSLFS